jgi:hypothetical protein
MLSVCGNTYSLTIVIVIQQPRTLASMLILSRLIVPWTVWISRRQSCSKAARASWTSLISGVNRRRGVMVCRRGRLIWDIQRLGRRSLTRIRHFLRHPGVDKQLLASSVIERREDGSEDDSTRNQGQPLCLATPGPTSLVEYQTARRPHAESQ